MKQNTSLSNKDYELQDVKRQTLVEKRKKPTLKKNYMPRHIAHICLYLLRHKPTQRQSQKSANSSDLLTPNITFDKTKFSMKNSLLPIIISLFLLSGCGGNKCKVSQEMQTENKLDESYCPQIDSTITPLPKPSIKKINIFFDASGSMSGFMPAAKQSSEMQILIPDIISKLKTKFSNSVTFFPIYSSNSPMKSLDVNDAETKIIYGNLTQSGGDTYLPTMLDSIYKSYFSPDAVNIFISDCIYSPKSNEKKQVEQATKEIRETISSYTKDYFTSAFCLFSKFNKIENSPYYLIVFGKPENNHVIEKIIVDAVKTKNQKFEQVNFGLKYDQPYYSVLPYSDNSPNCIANPCENLKDACANVTVQNWKDKGDSASFWIALDLKNLPSYSTTQNYLDSNLSLTMLKGTAKILAVTSSAPKGLDKDDKIIADKSSHFIHVQVSELEDCATTIHIGLKFSIPKWINALDQTETETNGEKTFGLVRMMNGFSEAYNQDKGAYFFNNLNVSLIKK